VLALSAKPPLAIVGRVTLLLAVRVAPGVLALILVGGSRSEWFGLLTSATGC
jgi:hypothetical protein